MTITMTKKKTTSGTKSEAQNQGNEEQSTRRTSIKSATSTPEAPSSETAPRASTKMTGIKTNKISQEERHHLISLSAYYLAEKRGFSPGNECHDWLEAERVVDQQLNKIK